MYEITHSDGTVVYWETWTCARSYAEYWGVDQDSIVYTKA